MFKMQKNFLKVLSFFTFPAAVFVFHLIISMFNIYDVYQWFDIPMHFLGGLAISYTAVLFFRFFREKGFFDTRKELLLVLFVVSIVSFVAVLWEFFEFFLKTFFNVITQPSLNDTLLDLFMGLFGGLIGGIIFRKV